MGSEGNAQTAGLFGRDESFSCPLSVTSDARTRVGVFLPMAINFRLAQDHGQDRERTSRRGGCCVQRGQPALHLRASDLVDGTLAKPGHDLVSQIRTVHGDGSRLPGSAVSPKNLLGDVLESCRFADGRLHDTGFVRSAVRALLRPHLCPGYLRCVDHECPPYDPAPSTRRRPALGGSMALSPRRWIGREPVMVFPIESALAHECSARTQETH